MGDYSESRQLARIRIGAVTYLNARPLTHCLPRLAPEARVRFELPSRLADDLSTGGLDVALIPSIEYFRNPGYAIVSDGCVACDGLVRSVKFYSRVPVESIRTLALDEGSRTSAALARILLKERYGVAPELHRLPIGKSPAEFPSDAVVVIGDRGMRPPEEKFVVDWDLGQEWSQWTGLPFVFALWVARPGLDLDALDDLLTTARDDGLECIEEIARRQAPLIGIPECECLSYLRENIEFRLGPRQREGLSRFYQLAAQHRLAPAGAQIVFHRHSIAR